MEHECRHEADFVRLEKEHDYLMKKSETHVSWTVFWSIVVIFVGIGGTGMNLMYSTLTDRYNGLSDRFNTLRATVQEGEKTQVKIETQLATIQTQLADISAKLAKLK